MGTLDCVSRRRRGGGGGGGRGRILLEADTFIDLDGPSQITLAGGAGGPGGGFPGAPGASGTFAATAYVTPVPEPASGVTTLAGLALLAARRRRRR
jgi:MYXO-CTERM domain-containing protein